MAISKYLLTVALSLALVACGGGSDSNAGTSKFGDPSSAGGGSTGGSTTTSALFTTAPDSLSMNVGETISSLAVAGGAGGYTVISANSAVLTATISDGKITLTGVSVGQSKVTAKDSAGTSVSFDVSVGSIVDLYSDAPTTITVPAGQSSDSFTIGGGTPPYTVTSANKAVASVSQVPGAKTFSVGGVIAGATSVKVTDSKGKAIPISVTVESSSSVQIPLFTDAPNSLTLKNDGLAVTYGVYGGAKKSDGTFAYAARSSSDQVVTASVAANSQVLTLTPVAAGNADVLVTDPSGAQIKLTVQVGLSTGLYVTAPTSLNLSLPGTYEFQVAGGSAPYAVTVSAPSVLDAGLSSGLVTLTARAVGTTNVTVVDSKGARAAVSVTVGSATPLVVDMPSTVSMTLNQTSSTYTISGGSPRSGVQVGQPAYSVKASDESVLLVTNPADGASTSNFKLKALKAGSSSVVVSDSAQNSKIFSVTVVGDPSSALSSVAPSSLTVKRGGDFVTYELLGGVPFSTGTNFRVSSSNPGVATVSTTGQAFTVTGVEVGSAEIKVVDQAGSSLTFQVSVTSELNVAMFTTAPSPVVLTRGGASVTYPIFGGLPFSSGGAYQVSSSNETFVSASLSGSNGLLLTPTATEGNATIFITDQTGAQLQVAVQVGAIPALQVPVNSPVGILPSRTLTFQVTGGLAPYSVTSSDGSIVSVPAAPVNNGVVTLTASAVSSGSALIAVADSAGQVKTIDVIVGGSSSPLTSTAPNSLTLARGANASGPFSISGGYPTYTVTSSDTTVATVVQTGASFTVSGVGSGTANVIIRDSTGSTTTIAVSVVSSQVYTTAPNTVLLDLLQSDQSFEIRGGVPSYLAASSNSGVVRAQVDTSGAVPKVALTAGQSVGSANVTIFDSLGSSAFFTVNVGALQPLFTTSPSVVTLMAGGSQTPNIDINGGAAGYTVQSADNNVTVVSSVDANTFKLVSVRPGSTTVSVKDVAGNEVVIAVSVVADLPLESTIPPLVNLGTSLSTNTASFGVSGGTAPYTVTSSVPSIVAAPANSISTSFTLVGLSNGVSTITVRDSSPTPKSLTASVNVSSGAGLSLAVSPLVETGVIGNTLHFEVVGGSPSTAASSNKYVVQSSNSSVASISAQPRTDNALTGFDVTLMGAGVAVITVTDSAGSQVSTSVTATAATVQPLSISAPSTLTLNPGDIYVFQIMGGTGSYTVNSSDTSKVAATSSSPFTLTAASNVQGPSRITIKDSANTTQTIDVTVQAAPLALSAPASGVSLRPGSSADYEISGGLTPFLSPTSSDSGIATATVIGAGLRTLRVTAGSNASVTPVTITVTDSSNPAASTNLQVSVTAAAAQAMTVSPAVVSGVVGDTSVIQIAGGLASYVVTSSNTSVVTTSGPDGSGRITLTLLRDGSATLAIKDATGQVQSVDVTVATQPTQLQLTPYSMVVSEGNTQQLTFTVGGGVKPISAYLSDTRKGGLTVTNPVLGNSTVALNPATGGAGNMCSATNDTLITSTSVNTTLLGSSSVKGYDLILTVVDSLGAQSYARIFVTDGACP